MAKKIATTQEIVNSIVNNEYFSRRLVFNNENDNFLWYDDDGNYIYLDKKHFHQFLFDFMEENFPDMNISTHLFREVFEFLMIKAPRQIWNEDEEVLSFKDKLFNLKDFEPKEKDKNIITSFNLPFKYEEVIKGETERFDQFLREIFVDDAHNPDDELIELVQEMCGSFLVPDMECSQAWFWVGEGGNGKSVFSKIIQSIFPEEICSSMNLQTITTNRWAMAHLVGKRLNISAEEESKYVSSDKFKALVFGDTVHAEEKFGKSFQFTPKAKYIFLTNNMPSLGAIDAGIKRRIQIIPFKRSFTKKNMDPFLVDKLKQELPGIIYWILDGARKIVAKNYQFSEPEVVSREMETFVRESNSSIEFIKENYKIDKESKTAVKEIYEHYKQWCQENGRKPLSKNNFVKDVKRELKIKTRTIRYGASTTSGIPLILKGEDIDF